MVTSLSDHASMKKVTVSGGSITVLLICSNHASCEMFTAERMMLISLQDNFSSMLQLKKVKLSAHFHK